MLRSGKDWSAGCLARVGTIAQHSSHGVERWREGNAETASLLRWPHLGSQAELLPLRRSGRLRLSIHRRAKGAECQRVGQSSEGLSWPRVVTSATPAVIRAALEDWRRRSQTLALGASVQPENAPSLALGETGDGWANANVPHRRAPPRRPITATQRGNGMANANPCDGVRLVKEKPSGLHLWRAPLLTDMRDCKR